MFFKHVHLQTHWCWWLCEKYGWESDMPIVINAIAELVRVSNDWLQLETYFLNIHFVLCGVCTAKEAPGISFTLMTVAKMAYIVIFEDAFLVWTGKWIIVWLFIMQTLVDFLPYLIEAKSLKLKAVLGCLMVLIPWIASAITSVARGREVYYTSDASHGTYETWKILFFFQKSQLYIYIYLFFRYHSISNLWSLHYSDCSSTVRQRY